MTSHGERRASATWRPGWLRITLAAALGFAGVIHLILTSEHFGESTAMGVGFVAAGMAELGLAAAVLVQPSRLIYLAVAAVTAALIGLYAFNVVVGLPFAGTEDPATTHEEGSEHAETSDHGDHHHQGLVVGSGEPIDVPGAATKLSEGIALGLAIFVPSRQNRGTA